MTASLSLEDTIATVLNETFGWWLNPTSPNVKRLAEALRAASVVPAEPATHEDPVFTGSINGVYLWLQAMARVKTGTDMRVVVYRERAAVAAVDGEAPA